MNHGLENIESGQRRSGIVKFQLIDFTILDFTISVPVMFEGEKVTR